jgi:hypothetical protein
MNMVNDQFERDDPWKFRPRDLDYRVVMLAKRAKELKVPADRLRKYTLIRIAAEEVLAHRARLEQKARDELAIAAASDHGVFTDDPKKASTAYAQARKAQQEVHASSVGCARRLEKLQNLLATRHKSLPRRVAKDFPIEKITSAISVIQGFAAASAPARNVLNFKMAHSDLSFTEAGHTYFWWRFYIPGKGRWQERYDLAFCWRLTDADCLENFKRQVKTLKSVRVDARMTSFLPCPPWALI